MLGTSDQVFSTLRVALWSAVTCHRFGRSRPVATMVRLSLLQGLRRQAAEGQSGDRSPHSKELTPTPEQLYAKTLA